MKCRRLNITVDETGLEHKDVVWFGSYGKNQEGSAKFYNPEDKHDNYSEKQNGVRDSLIQRLSVIKGELWYKASYGLPLMDKIKSKGIFDSIIVDIITSHPDVYNMENFSSEIINHKYEFYCEIITIYNERINLSSTI